MQQGKFERLGVTRVAELIHEAKNKPIPENLLDKFVEKWEAIAEKPLLTALEARSRERNQSMEKYLNDHIENEIQKLATVLTELREKIEKELNEPEFPVQLELFSTPEREQFERNKDSLRRRLVEIPEEIARETEAIRRRYSNPRPLLFPLAITVLFPESMV